PPIPCSKYNTGYFLLLEYPGGVYTNALRFTPTVFEGYEMVSIFPCMILDLTPSKPSGACSGTWAFIGSANEQSEIKRKRFFIALSFLRWLEFEFYFISRMYKALTSTTVGLCI